MNATEGYIMADGNTAAALGSIYGGVQFAAWYPITPASSLAESLVEYLPIRCAKIAGWQEHLCGGAGRRRAGRDRHGGRRGLGRAALDDLHLRPGLEPDGRIRRAGLFCRSADSGLGCAAGWPQHRPAHPHSAGRPDFRSFHGPWRYPACNPAARLGERVL